MLVVERDVVCVTVVVWLDVCDGVREPVDVRDAVCDCEAVEVSVAVWEGDCVPLSLAVRVWVPVGDRVPVNVPVADSLGSCVEV